MRFIPPPQVACAEKEKETFWEQMDPARSECDTGWRKSDCRIVPKLAYRWSSEGIERINGGWGMGDRNDEGENIVGTAMAFDLATVYS